MSTIVVLYDLPRVLDRLMDQDECGGGICTGEHLAASPFPPVQVLENERCTRVRALLPGMTRSSITLELVHDTLVLYGRLPEVKGRYHRHERRKGVFRRSIPLPCPVADAPVEATFRNGVLTVTLPKSALNPRRAVRARGSFSGDGS